jgi:HlyD family secretion protein
MWSELFCRVGQARLCERRPTVALAGGAVGRRGEAPLDPPYKIGRPSLVVAFVLAAGCDKPAPPPAPAAASAAPAITLVEPVKRPVKRVVEQPGAVVAYEEADLFAKIPGYVQKVSADIGLRVKAGQVLAELAVPELEQEAKQKEAQTRQAVAELEQAKKALAAAEAGVSSAEAMVNEAKAAVARADALAARWRSEVARVGGLVSGGVIDASTRDETRNQADAAEATRAEAAAKVASAEAAVRKAKADRDKAVADVAADDARLDVARADARRHDALLGYTKIAAPFDGVVTRRDVDTGDYVHGVGKESLFRVARVDPVRVVVAVPEADAGLVAEGSPARIAVQALPGPELTGTVARTSWGLDPGARTLRAEVDVPNPDGKLRPGMYAYARVTAELPAAWAVPAAAVGKAGDDFVVYLAAGGKAVRCPVQVLRGDGQFTQVRRYKKPGAADWTDVTGGERFASPAAALTDGQVLPPDAPKPAAP